MNYTKYVLIKEKRYVVAKEVGNRIDCIEIEGNGLNKKNVVSLQKNRTEILFSTELPCGKKRLSQQGAEVQLTSINSGLEAKHRKEKRSYYCANCKSFHLTSKEIKY
jgi:hypothetical protein